MPKRPVAVDWEARVHEIEATVHLKDEEIRRLKRLLAGTGPVVPQKAPVPTNTERHRLAEQQRAREELAEAQGRRDQALRTAFPQKAYGKPRP